jgi:hypothetical protein
MWSGNRYRCFRGLRGRWNARSERVVALTSRPGVAIHLRSPHSVGTIDLNRPGGSENRPYLERSSLSALFEGCGFAAQVGERFPGEMKRTGQQDRG